LELVDKHKPLLSLLSGVNPLCGIVSLARYSRR
jgi:hypothetical protein